MTDLLLHEVDRTGKTVTLGWTPPAGIQWYLFYSNGDRVSNAAPVDKNGVVKNTVRFTVADTLQVVAIVTAGSVWSVQVGTFSTVVTPPPVDPPPVPSGKAVNTNGRNDMTIANQSITLPPEDKDINVACVYISGASQRTRLGPNLKLKGGYLCVKQYGQAKDIVIDGVDLSGAGGDLMHFDQAVGVHVDNVYGHSPVDGGEEHHDFCQIQAGSGYYFGPGVVCDWPVDFPNNGFMISQYGPFLFDVTIDRVTIKGHKHAGGLQMFCGGTIISPTITNQDGGPKMTLQRPPDGRMIVLRSAATGMWAKGVKRADIVFNDFSGSGWPSYVQVDP